MASVLVPLAQGCEELEAITVVDLLRRAGIDVVTAGLDDRPVRASRGSVLLPDMTLHENAAIAVADGHSGHRASEVALERLLEAHAKGWLEAEANALKRDWQDDAADVLFDLNNAVLASAGRGGGRRPGGGAPQPVDVGGRPPGAGRRPRGSRRESLRASRGSHQVGGVCWRAGSEPS